MAKRRTKKQKQKAKHNLTVSWGPKKTGVQSGLKNRPAKAAVKRQLQNEPRGPNLDIKRVKRAKNSEKYENIRTIKQDIIKSLVLAGLIIGSEIVLYLFLQS